MPSHSNLDSLIRATVVELVESAPQPPPLFELEYDGPTRVTRSRRRERRSDYHRRRALLSGLAVSIAALIVALVLLPSSGPHRPPATPQRIAAAATAFHEIALNAARQPVPQLSSDEYLLTSQQVTFEANIGQVGNVPTPNAKATVTATISEWSNNQDESCIEATSGPATFASPSNEAA